jgi:hypothetical protein
MRALNHDEYAMKIHQLPLGARFEYEGEEYVKTAALFATGKAGQRLIPKYAVLKPLDAVVTPSAPKSETLPRAAVMRALDAFCAQCATWIPLERRAELEAARDGFVRAIDE